MVVGNKDEENRVGGGGVEWRGVYVMVSVLFTDD